MRILFEIKTVWLQVPANIRTFLSRALLVFIIWKLLYHLLLFPIRFPDRQLTYSTARLTAVLYRVIVPGSMSTAGETYKNNFPISVVYIGGRKGVSIADSCNGLELHILYIGFLLCMPTTISRQIYFIVGGILVIYILNVFRCFGLAWLYFNNYGIADFAHKYLFKMIIYGLIFFAWVKYSKKVGDV